jgi:hypothetical protein
MGSGEMGLETYLCSVGEGAVEAAEVLDVKGNRYGLFDGSSA